MLAAVGVIGRHINGILSIEPWNRSLTVTTDPPLMKCILLLNKY
jgi:hypothetical protein